MNSSTFVQDSDLLGDCAGTEHQKHCRGKRLWSLRESNEHDAAPPSSQLLTNFVVRLNGKTGKIRQIRVKKDNFLTYAG
jgi:hypothetical protein